MSRYYLLIVVVMAAGCQNPNQPFNPYGNTRVPPPATGSYGQQATTAPYYNVPPATSGAPTGASSIGGASFPPNPALQTNQLAPPPGYPPTGWRATSGATAQPAYNPTPTPGYPPTSPAYPTSPAPTSQPTYGQPSAYGQPPVGSPPPTYNGTNYSPNIN